MLKIHPRHISRVDIIYIDHLIRLHFTLAEGVFTPISHSLNKRVIVPFYTAQQRLYSTHSAWLSQPDIVHITTFTIYITYIFG